MFCATTSVARIDTRTLNVGDDVRSNGKLATSIGIARKAMCLFLIMVFVRRGFVAPLPPLKVVLMQLMCTPLLSKCFCVNFTGRAVGRTTRNPTGGGCAAPFLRRPHILAHFKAAPRPSLFRGVRQFVWNHLESVSCHFAEQLQPLSTKHSRVVTRQFSKKNHLN